MNVVRVLLTALLVVVLIPVMASLGSVTGGSTAIDPTASYQTLDGRVSGEPGNIDVSATTGTALALDGSTTVGVSGPAIGATSWTVCTVGELDSGADRAAAYTLVAYRNESIHLTYSAGTWTAYYNDSTKSALVRVADANPSDGLTPVCARFNETGLSLYANGTFAGPVTLDTTTETRQTAWNWTGRIDETRVYDGYLNNSETRAYGADPVEPRDGPPRLLRLMFDEGSGDTTTAYFAPASTATIANPGWTSGAADPSLQRGTDYEISTGPFALRAPAGGYLDGAPVAYVSWGSGSVLTVDWPSLFALFAALLALVYIGNRLDLV